MFDYIFYNQAWSLANRLEKIIIQKLNSSDTFLKTLVIVRDEVLEIKISQQLWVPVSNIP